MLDIRTGILLLAFGNCCAAVLLLVHGVGERGRGSRLFLRGKLAQSVGWLFMGLRGLEADMLPILLGNGLLYAGFALESAALLRFSGLLGSWSRRFLIAVVCGALAAQALVFDSPNLRQSLGGLALALCLARPGFLLAFTPGGTALRRFMGAAYLACAGALLANAAVFLLVRTEGHVYTPGADQTIAGLMLYLLMLDLDHFKAVNDTHGHAVGDDVLRDFSARVRSRLRPYDLFGRYGGEEFCVLLPATGAEAAVGVAERIRTSMPREPFRDLPAYTVSIGVATLGEHSTLDDLLRESDLAMYQAKAQGRDRVRLQRAGESEE